MDHLTQEILNNFSFSTKDFEKKFVHIELGIPYISILMDNFVKLYPSLKVSKFLRLKSNPNIIIRTCMLNEGTPPVVFFASERVEAQEGQPETIECFFLREYFNEISNFIMKNEQKKKVAPLLN